MKKITLKSLPEGYQENPEIVLIMPMVEGLQRIVDGFNDSTATIQENLIIDDDMKMHRLGEARRGTQTELDELSNNIKIDAQGISRRVIEIHRTTPPAMGETLIRYQEIRTALRCLPDRARKAVLSEVVKTRDYITCDAVREGRPFLSGLDSKTHAQFLKDAAEALFGAELNNLVEAEKVLKELTQLVDQVRTFIESTHLDEHANAA